MFGEMLFRDELTAGTFSLRLGAFLTYQWYEAVLRLIYPNRRADGIAGGRGAEHGRFQLITARAPDRHGEGNETLRRSKNDMAALAGNVKPVQVRNARRAR
jgi:hypothetical protein